MQAQEQQAGVVAPNVITAGLLSGVATGMFTAAFAASGEPRALTARTNHIFSGPASDTTLLDVKEHSVITPRDFTTAMMRIIF